MASPSSGTTGAEGNPSSKSDVPVAQWVFDRTQTPLVDLRLKYHIPPSVVLRVLEYKEQVACPEGDKTVFFEEALQARALFRLS